MGSKRVMLQNGLGDILAREGQTASRVVDLFCGSGSVSWFAATKLRVPVLACDLQRFATTLAGAVIERTCVIEMEDIETRWLARAGRVRSRLAGWAEARDLDESNLRTEALQRRARKLCSLPLAGARHLIWQHYGGHYFSPRQALTFDAMRRALPEDREFRTSCLAAMVIAASQCAASPGHTAQPFKASGGAAKYLREAWARDPMLLVRRAAHRLCALHAARPGVAKEADANEVASTLRKTDLVFVDPPYSGVQYSRFYHVLETVARGACGPVDGVGRYPPPPERPNSRYSRVGRSRQAMRELLETLAGRGCTVVVTFPEEECSNGLSGEEIENIAGRVFRVEAKTVTSRFSTLGGNRTNRSARKITRELILVLKRR